MTFWERFYKLCEENNSKPNPVAKNIGISSGVLTKWKNGALPNSDALIKIAEFFNCSTDYLLGKTNTKKQTPNDGQPVSDDLEELMKVSSSLSPDNLFLLRKLAEQLVDKQNQEES